MEESSLNRFHTIEKELDDLQKTLSDPELISRPEAKTYFARMSALTPIAQKIKDVKKIQKQLAETHELFTNESDKDLRSLAKEEHARLKKIEEQAIQAIVLEISNLEKEPSEQKEHVLIEIRAG